MVRRLALGCGAVGYRVIEELAELPGDLSVLEPDESRVDTLRGVNVAAERTDPTDPAGLKTLDWPAETVLILGDDAAWNRRAAEAAREAYPGASLMAYTGITPDPADRKALAEVADRVVEHGPAAAARLLQAITGEAGERLRRLVTTLRRVDGHLGVFAHDNPDPDAIASAIALRTIAQWVGTEATACYFGDISHQENRALVNLLELDLTHVDGEEAAAFDEYALVDHSQPGINDQLPPDTSITVVIDHHPPREPVDARFVDLRSEVGATSTLLAGYLGQLGIEPPSAVASALLYGIRVDTRDFERDITGTDFDAAAYLLEYADQDVLDRVESPSVTGDTLDTVARSITGRRRRGDALAAPVGRINDRDALAQAADQLLSMEGVATTFVYGILEGTVYGSARTRGAAVDIGEVLRDAFDQIGSAGGHADMAGVQLPLGILGTSDPDAGTAEDLEAVVAEVVTNRFFEVLEAHRAAGREVSFDVDELVPLADGIADLDVDPDPRSRVPEEDSEE